MTPETFQDGMMRLAGAFPREMVMGPESVAVWMRYLDHMEDGVFLALVNDWIRSEERAPTIAGLLKRGERVAQIDADTAWTTVLDIVRNGRYRQDGFACDEAIAAGVSACGSWRAIAFSNETDLRFLRRDFVDAYGRFMSRMTISGELGSGMRLLGEGGQ